MLNDFGIDERFFEGLEMSKRAFLAGIHQTAVPHDIRGQNGQPPLYVLAAQDAPPSSGKLNGIYQNCGPMSGYAPYGPVLSCDKAKAREIGQHHCPCGGLGDSGS